MKKIRFIIGYLLLILGITLSFMDIYSSRNKTIKEVNKVSSTLQKEISYREAGDTYDAVLVIPKINLKKGIYRINDKRNNIEENIMIHKDSIYPDKDNSNVILIAHSGSGRLAFFKDLNKLDTDSLIEFYYKHTKYIYKIEYIYNTVKNGTINLLNNSFKTISLITCNPSDKTKQTVYIGNLVDQIEY